MLKKGILPIVFALLLVATVLQAGEAEEDGLVTNFTFEPETPLTFQTVFFWDESTYNGENVTNWPCNFTWDFGDGSVSYEKNPQHEYTKAGTYNITHTVVLYLDGNTTKIDSVTKQIIVRNRKPVAKFYWTRSDGQLTFYANFPYDSSYDPDGVITNYTWNFGDGNFAYGIVVSHEYGSAGEYNVTLTVYDDDGDSNSTYRIIHSANKLPMVNFSYSPLNPTDLDTITFVSSSYDPDGHIANYTWEFGDGSFAYNDTVSHKYDDDGSYNVRLQIIDNEGAFNSTQKIVYVSNVPPVANFSWEPFYPIPERNVTFNASSSFDLDGYIKNYTWDFGDGSFGYGEVVKHNYSSSGIYNITLTVYDDDGANSSMYTSLLIADFYVDENVYDPANHTWTKIQDAIDNATDGTFIYVREGIYHEDVSVDKEVIIEGKNAIVSGSEYSFSIEKNGVKLLNLTITDSNKGIIFSSSHCIVENCEMSGNEIGAIIYGDNNAIRNSTISSLNTSILIYGNENDVEGNYINGGMYGIKLQGNENTIFGNDIKGFYGILLIGEDNQIEENDIYQCSFGIHLDNDNTILNNSFSSNGFGIYAEIDAFIGYNEFLDNYYSIFSSNFVEIHDAIFVGNIVSISSGNAYVENVSIEGGGTGIEIEEGEIKNSSINDATKAINASHALIFNCNIEDCGIGICGEYNEIFNTTLSFNGIGINGENSIIENSSLYKNTYGIMVANCIIKNTSFIENENGALFGENNTIFNSFFSLNSNAIWIDGEENKIMESTIDGNDVGISVESSRNMFENNYIANNTYGMKILSAPYNSLFSNTFINNTYNFDMIGSKLHHFYQSIPVNNTANNKPFFYLINGSNMDISGDYGYFALINCDNISVNELETFYNGEGLLMVECSNISINGGNFSYNLEGIYILRGENIILNNIYTGNNIDGISSKSSSYLSIFNCTAKNNAKGINLFNVERNEAFITLYNISLEGNVNGINVENLEEVSIEKMMAKKNEEDANFYNSNVSIKNCEMNGSTGIKANNADIEIFNVSFFNTFSIDALASSIQFMGCNLSNASTAIKAWQSSIDIISCIFSNNEISFNISNSDIYINKSKIDGDNENLLNSSSIKIVNTTFCNNSNALNILNSDGLIYSCEFYSNSRALFIMNSSLNVLNESMYQNGYCIVIEASNNVVMNGTFWNNSIGISINGTGNIIREILFHHNNKGILIDGSYNIIKNCSFWKNFYGIVADGINNTIYHNNFVYNAENAIENGENIWNISYPEGGNYWYDYAGEDLFSGKAQNESGSDGIGDIPYEIDGSVDSYPLMDYYAGAAHMPNEKPIANFYFYPASPFSLEKVVFVDTSYDENGKMDIVSWHWNFGDGNTSDEKSPSHSYKKPGWYNVTLEVEDRAGEKDNVTYAIHVRNLAPVANFSWQPETIHSHDLVDFDASSSYDADGYIVNYTWDFGDGSFGYGMSLTHKYTKPAEYKVTLTIKDDNGSISTHEAIIEVGNRPPSAQFAYVPEEPTVGEKINFSDLSSDVDGNIVEWKWIFGDGSISFEKNPSHEYTEAGEYKITLIVKDDKGMSANITKTIKVMEKEMPSFELFIFVVAVIAIIVWRKRLR